jgi:acetaldehyde dehydrogenase (acetylating)
MTLGCGGWGGNITSDNISPRHLLNIKRLAYELRPARRAGASPAPAGSEAPAAAAPAAPGLLRGPVTPPKEGLRAETLVRRIDQFLQARGFGPAAEAAPAPGPQRSTGAVVPGEASPTAAGRAADFICEEDVRHAIAAGQTLLVGERTIVTPAARDLGEAKRAFTYEQWRP